MSPDLSHCYIAVVTPVTVCVSNFDYDISATLYDVQLYIQTEYIRHSFGKKRNSFKTPGK
jgi:hypothetical protein